MPTPQQIQQAIEGVNNQPSFIQNLLIDTLEWQIPEGISDIEEISFAWTDSDLNAEGLDKKIVDGKVSQLQPMQQNQQWGIFLLEFKNADTFIKGRGLTGPLRKVLRGLVRKKRQQANRPAWDMENLLFICTNNYRHYRFAYFKAPSEKEKTSPLAMFGWNYRDSEIRTLCQHNLPCLEWNNQSNWQQAFSIEKVTKEFYKAYAAVFEAAEDFIAKANKGLKDDKMRLFTQMLFNRLMFLRFVEKKGWLKFGDGRDYLKNLFAAKGLKSKSFYKSRLCPLFFEGLAIEKPNCGDAVGDVPFLNGGLFEMTDLDKDVSDIPDEAFNGIIGDDGLFYHFNFTVEESTPLDIEVAVDPEMLGKVFEELVTGRHESGSYYTPRPIVSFMCKEALKGFLCGKTIASKEAIEKLVDDHEVAQGLTDFHAEEILYYLDTIKACDPACGSGAYLLGLLQELIAIRRTLQNERLLADAAFMYKLKLGIISRSLYGVDIDEFATNVAKLRLWLSLAVEAEKPQPLPNLDFKIETGDSVLGPCTPYLETEEALTMSALRERAKHLVLKKDRFMTAHGTEKRGLFDEIRQEEAAIARETATVYGKNVIAWHIHFAEVFISGRRQQQIDRKIADIGDFKVTTIEPGGFDIVLANPPYIRQELIKDIKPRLKEVFPQTFAGTADIYTYFYTRAVEMLGPGGVLAFISSNKWFRANYGSHIRKYLAEECSVLSITDFMDSPIFESATAYPMIFIAQKTKSGHKTVYTETRVASGNDLDVKGVLDKYGRILQDDSIKGKEWSFIDGRTDSKLKKMKSVSVTLSEYVSGKLYRGLLTGLNKAFVIDSTTRKALIAQHPACKELIKPVVEGKDISRWTVSQTKWLIVTPIGVDIAKYPSILSHLQQWEKELEVRCDQGNHWWEYRACSYYKVYEVPQIMWGNLGLKPPFAYTPGLLYTLAPANSIPTSDLYLLGVMNSSSADFFFSQTAIQRNGGYYEYKPMYVKSLPIPQASEQDKKAISKLVQKCLYAKGVDCEAWEKEIDERIAALYGL
jgi:type I restriction-modification system DNA methylase subunit